MEELKRRGDSKQLIKFSVVCFLYSVLICIIMEKYIILRYFVGIFCVPPIVLSYYVLDTVKRTAAGPISWNIYLFFKLAAVNYLVLFVIFVFMDKEIFIQYKLLRYLYIIYTLTIMMIMASVHRLGTDSIIKNKEIISGIVSFLLVSIVGVRFIEAMYSGIAYDTNFMMLYLDPYDTGEREFKLNMFMFNTGIQMILFAYIVIVAYIKQIILAYKK